MVMMYAINAVTTSVIINITTILIANAASVESSSADSLLIADEVRSCPPYGIYVHIGTKLSTLQIVTVMDMYMHTHAL